MYQTIAQNVEAEIVEKKSKFIAHICYVNSEEMAEQEYQKICKKYHDARHNCYAYRIQKDGEMLTKSSDDGEPSGTAGAPMLNLLVQNNLANVLIVVTRYFGGILLGTGGLVRAYTEASKKALEQAEFVTEEEGVIAEMEVSYPQTDFVKYYCKKKEIEIQDISFGQTVKFQLRLTKEEYVEIQDAEKSKLKIESAKILEEKYIRKRDVTDNGKK